MQLLLFFSIMAIFLGKGVLPFLFPGCVIAVLLRRFIDPAFDRFVYAIGCSIAWWMLCWMWQPLLHFQLTNSYWFTVILTLVVLGYMVLKTDFKRIDFKNLLPKDLSLSLIFFTAILMMRFIPFNSIFVPPGVNDMSLHTLIAKLIRDANAMPMSLEPYFPIKVFPEGAWGFSALTAFISLLGGLPIEKAAILLTWFTYVLISLALALLATHNYPVSVRIAIGGLVTFCAPSPQLIVGWGGNPTVLSLFFVFLLASLIRPPSLFPNKNVLWFMGALYLSAVFIIQPMPLVAYFYIALPPFLYALYNRIVPPSIILPIFGMIVLCALLLMPFWLHPPPSISSYLHMWIGMWQTYQLKLPTHTLIKQFPGLVSLHEWLVLPVFIITQIGIAIFFMWKKGSEDWWYLAGTFLLLTNVFVWWLPFSFLLYPERVILLALIPTPFILLLWWQDIRSFKMKIIAVLLVIVGVGTWWYKYAGVIPKKAPVTYNDFKAIKWMEANLPKGALIGNNFSDAGAWIPVLTNLPITHPHLNPFIHPYLPKGLPIGTPQYIFAGEKKAYKGGINFNPAALKTNSRQYKLVHQEGEAVVYQVVPEIAK